MTLHTATAPPSGHESTGRTTVEVDVEWLGGLVACGPAVEPFIGSGVYLQTERQLSPCSA